MNLPVYIGKSEYCYANSAAMLLASAGYTVPPGTIEVLTGMGVGAAWIEASDALLAYVRIECRDRDPCTLDKVCYIVRD